MRRQWYYRGSLKSCNYSCSYCPFSKGRGSDREWQQDREALFRFIERLEDCRGSGAVQIVPYGEALIHPYYWEGLAALSRNPRLDAVGAQSNFSFPAERMLSVYREQGGELAKLRLWGTFHPEMTTVERFLDQCRLLAESGVQYCVGAVGVPQQLDLIRRLRRELPSSVYLWINKMDGLGRSYTEAERQAFLELDEYFDLELAHHRADPSRCGDNRFVEADGTMRRCNLCRQSMGNFYREAEGRRIAEPAETLCSRKECDCYLSYCNRREWQLLFFGPYPAFRIPCYPKAAFFDIDGTLIPAGRKQIPAETVRRLRRLAGHCDLYFATSLPYEIARKKVAPVWEAACGGVFASGGRRVISRPGRETETDEVIAVDTGWLARAGDAAGRYGYVPHVYRKGACVYKVTLEFRRGRLPEKGVEQYVRGLAGELGIPDSCRILREENCVQVMGEGTGKREGVLQICRAMGYGEQEVAVFGDSENDLPMLEYFPFSVNVCEE